MILLLLSNYAGSLAFSEISAFPVTSTPIKHLVIIFQENVSFDHYFATYPYAKNPPNEPYFLPSRYTPSVNGLNQTGLLSNNPNVVNPFRLDRSQPTTCDMNHTYTAEQKAYDGGLLDKFVQFTGSKGNNCDPKQVLGYYDGNTVTALWNYAQHFAMSDNFYGSTFGPSLPGAINLVSGQTHGATPLNAKDTIINGTVIGDGSPFMRTVYKVR
jgi:phospholipase C